MHGVHILNPLGQEHLLNGSNYDERESYVLPWGSCGLRERERKRERKREGGGGRERAKHLCQNLSPWFERDGERQRQHLGFRQRPPKALAPLSLSLSLSLSLCHFLRVSVPGIERLEDRAIRVPFHLRCLFLSFSN